MSKQKRLTKKPTIATTTNRPTAARVVSASVAPKNPTVGKPTTNPRTAKSQPTAPIIRPVTPPPAPISRPLAATARAEVPTDAKVPPAPPPVRPKMVAVPSVAETSATDIKQNSALALPTKGQIARLMSAITRAFPYAGVEYVVFLALIEYNPMAAWVMGILAVVGGIGLAGLRAMRPASQPALAWEELVVSWFGQVYCIAGSVAAFGLGLLAWSRWHATNSAFFSGVSVVALIAALLLLVAASYLRQEA